MKIWSIGSFVCLSMLGGCDSNNSMNHSEQVADNSSTETHESQVQQRTKIIGGVPVDDRDYELNSQFKTQVSEQNHEHKTP